MTFAMQLAWNGIVRYGLNTTAVAGLVFFWFLFFLIFADKIMCDCTLVLHVNWGLCRTVITLEACLSELHRKVKSGTLGYLNKAGQPEAQLELIIDMYLMR